MLGAICVNTWHLKDGVLGDKIDELKNQFYERVDIEMIENNYDEAHNTISRHQDWVDRSSILDQLDGRILS